MSYVITTPGTVDLTTHDRYVVDIKREGHQPTTAVIGRRVNPWIIGNILLGGIIGLAVDLASGAAWKLDTDNVHVNLVPLGQKKVEEPKTGVPEEKARAPGVGVGAERQRLGES